MVNNKIDWILLPFQDTPKQHGYLATLQLDGLEDALQRGGDPGGLARLFESICRLGRTVSHGRPGRRRCLETQFRRGHRHWCGLPAHREINVAIRCGKSLSIGRLDYANDLRPLFSACFSLKQCSYLLWLINQERREIFPVSTASLAFLWGQLVIGLQRIGSA